MIGPKNMIRIVVLGATGKVGRLVWAASRILAQSEISIWFQARHGESGFDGDWVVWDPVGYPDGLARLNDRIGGIDYMINLAGVTASGPNVNNRGNSEIAIRSLIAAKDLDVRHCFNASSSAIYGRPKSQAPLTESDSPAPANDYGRSKLIMEHDVSDWCKKKKYARVTTLRIGNIVGADALILRAAKATHLMPVKLDIFPGGVSALRSYIGAVTFTRVLFDLILAHAAGRTLPPVLNVATPAPLSMSELLRAFRDLVNPVEITNVAAPNLAIPKVVLDTKLLESYCSFSDSELQAQDMIQQWLDCRRAL